MEHPSIVSFMVNYRSKCIFESMRGLSQKKYMVLFGKNSQMADTSPTPPWGTPYSGHRASDVLRELSFGFSESKHVRLGHCVSDVFRESKHGCSGHRVSVSDVLRFS